jgi:phospholipid transport system substrate-binding protein
LLLALSAGVVAGAPAPAMPQETPRQIVEETVAQVLEVLRQELPKEERRARLEEIVVGRFDFRTMSRLVLAKNWKKFSDAQQQEFVEAYKTYLANSYGARLDRYSGEEVEVIGERREERGDVTIKTRVLGGEYDGALVDYRMRGNDGPWLVIDVIIEGISLVSNYRDQFKEVLSNGGPENLLAKLKEKNAAGEIDEI